MRQSLLVSKNKYLEGNYVKKISLILALTLVLVSAFAVVALADPSQPNNSGNPAAGIYSDGTPGAVYLPGGDIHSNYKANTDACSACHAVHTGNGEALLQWAEGLGGISDICMSCHDGTVTATYDVLTGHVGDAVDGLGNPVLSNAGLFAVKNGLDPVSASQHAVFNGTLVKAAFGGAVAATGADTNGGWTAEFDCVACHTPHGQGGNVRILDPNPNWVMTQGTDPSAKNAKKGVNGAQLAVDLTDNTKYYFSTATITATTKDARSNVITTLPGKKPILGRPYTPVVYVGGVKQNVGTNNTAVNPAATANTAFVTFDAAGAYVKLYTATAATVTVDYTPAIAVDMVIAGKLTAAETVTYNSGMNNFCGACHTDYNTSSQAVRDLAPWNNKIAYGATSYVTSTGATVNIAPYQGNQYSVKTRHGVGTEGVKNYILQPNEKGTLTCITCHFAHGVDQSRWADYATKTGITDYNSAESQGSSKLKRLPNMGVCEVCHQKEVGAYSQYNQISW
jgi:predicted CXXCH cytochrome family protein